VISNSGVIPTHIGENRVHTCIYCNSSFYKGFKFHMKHCLEELAKVKPPDEVCQLIEKSRLNYQQKRAKIAFVGDAMETYKNFKKV
jgi:hypothetical protein